MSLKLDRTRPFGIVYGGPRRYEQDGLLFDVDGNLVGERPTLHTKSWSGDKTTPKVPKPTK